MSTEIKITREALQAKADKALADAEAKVSAYNDAIQNDKPLSELVEIRKDIDNILGDFASYKKFLAFEACAASPDPMLAAIDNPTYLVGKFVEEVPDGGKFPVARIDSATKAIDLLQLHKHIKGGIGHDKKWPYIVEALNSKLTARVGAAIGLNPTEIMDSYAMSNIARDIDLGKNPTSNTNLLKTMRTVVAAMVGEEYGNKVTSHDVAFILECYSKKSRKALTLSVANHKTLRTIMGDVCRAVTHGESYAIDYKKVDPNKGAKQTEKSSAKTVDSKKPAPKAAKGKKAAA